MKGSTLPPDGGSQIGLSEREEDVDNWGDDAHTTNWVKHKENKPMVRIIFTSDKCSRGKNQFHNMNWIFPVVEVGDGGGNTIGLYGVTSVRLLTDLKSYRPLTDKCFEIERTGQGTNTKYFVRLLKTEEAREAIKAGGKA